VSKERIISPVWRRRWAQTSVDHHRLERAFRGNPEEIPRDISSMATSECLRRLQMPACCGTHVNLKSHRVILVALGLGYYNRSV
jgi:hypothetical protein